MKPLEIGPEPSDTKLSDTSLLHTGVLGLAHLIGLQHRKRMFYGGNPYLIGHCDLLELLWVAALVWVVLQRQLTVCLMQQHTDR